MSRATAKVILVGEHFVVPSTDARGGPLAGSAAVAIPLPDLHTEVNLHVSGQVRCELDSKSRELGFGEDAGELMEKALRFAANRFQWDLAARPLHAVSSSNFPASRGLGSSASFSVALTREFSRLTSKPTDVRTEAQFLENLFHGKSSGLDTSTIAADSAILFQGGEIVKKVEREAVDVVVADSGPRETCSTLVSRTLEFRRNKPELWKTLSTEISTLSQQCALALSSQGGAKDIATIVRNAQEILAQIGLMTEGLESLLNIGRKAGALAGKLSGAGSGGVALFVANRGEGHELARRMGQAGARIVTVA